MALLHADLSQHIAAGDVEGSDAALSDLLDCVERYARATLLPQVLRSANPANGVREPC